MSSCELIDSDDESLFAVGNKDSDGVYTLREKVLRGGSAYVAKLEGTQLWHERLGHMPERAIQEMVSGGKAVGISLEESANTTACDDCAVGKETRKPFRGKLESTNEIGGIIHTDLCGPRPTSIGRHNYFGSLIDEKSRSAKIVFLKKKSEMRSKFEEFHRAFENENDVSIKAVHSDRGKEYVGLDKNLKTEGIRLEMSAAYCPESNGIAERYNRTLTDKVRAMLSKAGLPETFWSEAANYANYLREVIPTRLPDGVYLSPYERRTGKKPNLKHLKFFRCMATVHSPKEKRKKLNDRAWNGIFVGTERYDTFRVYDCDTEKAEIVRNVRFDETIFPGVASKSDIDDDSDYAVDAALDEIDVDFSSTESTSSLESDTDSMPPLIDEDPETDDDGSESEGDSSSDSDSDDNKTETESNATSSDAASHDEHTEHVSEGGGASSDQDGGYETSSEMSRSLL